MKTIIGLAIITLALFAFTSCSEEELPQPQLESNTMFDEEGYELAGVVEGLESEVSVMEY